MGGSGSGGKRNNRVDDILPPMGKNLELDIAERWDEFDWTNPDSGFIIFPKNAAEKLRNTELQRQKEEAVRLAMVKDSVLNVPETPKEFYRAAGPVILNNKGKPVQELADYQWEVWNSLFDHHYTIVIKSQKIGLTTLALWADFQLALLPRSHPRSCRGQEILIIAQTLDMARRHLQTLREMIVRSRYKSMLVTKPTEVLFRDQVTKVGVIYIKNPDDHTSPTRIIGLGPREGSIWSFKQVKHIHVSDIVASDLDYSQALNAALTRLANTDGTMLIETPPRGPQGRVYEIWQKANDKSSDDTEAAFWPIKIPVDRAVEAGIITKEYLQAQKALMGAAYNAFFNAEFLSYGGNVLPLSEIQTAVAFGKNINVESAWLDQHRPRSMGVDIGYGSSGTAFTITQIRKNKVEIVYSKAFRDSSPSSMIDVAWQLAQKYSVRKIFVDGSNPGYIRDLKRRYNEPLQYEYQIAQIKGNKLDPTSFMTVVPINFNQRGVEMIAHLQYLFNKGHMAIPDAFSDLLVELRSAQEDGKGNLDKSQNTMDLFDSLRLSCLYYKPVASRPSSSIPPTPNNVIKR